MTVISGVSVVTVVISVTLDKEVIITAVVTVEIIVTSVIFVTVVKLKTKVALVTVGSTYLSVCSYPNRPWLVPYWPIFSRPRRS